MYPDGFLAPLVVGLVAGWIADQATGSRHGLSITGLVGVVGAILGAFLADVFGMSSDRILDSVLQAGLGAAVVLSMFVVVRRRA
jgi:uncharacterized membrane protein YeaQ/YmgE (transglycosylase-associated protein family)